MLHLLSHIMHLVPSKPEVLHKENLPQAMLADNIDRNFSPFLR